MSEAITSFKRGVSGMITGALIGVPVGAAVFAAFGSFVPQVTDFVNSVQYARSIGDQVAAGITEDVGVALGDAAAAAMIGIVVGPIVGGFFGIIYRIWYSDL